MGIPEKIKAIQDEMARTQINKATEHHLGLLKAKIAKLKKEEVQKIKELELAKKEAEKEFEKKKKELNVDKDSPEILVAEKITVSSQVYKLKGKVKDSSDFFLEIDGQPVQINEEGEFLFSLGEIIQIGGKNTKNLKVMRNGLVKTGFSLRPLELN